MKSEKLSSPNDITKLSANKKAIQFVVQYIKSQDLFFFIFMRSETASGRSVVETKETHFQMEEEENKNVNFRCLPFLSPLNP